MDIGPVVNGDQGSRMPSPVGRGVPPCVRAVNVKGPIDVGLGCAINDPNDFALVVVFPAAHVKLSDGGVLKL
jgi:hypothetical protein